MKVYFAKYEIYEDVYGDLCDPSYGSFVFTDFDKAHEYVKERIDYWLEKYRESNKKDCYYDDWDRDVRCEFTIQEMDTCEDASRFFEWRFYYDGTLKDRYRCEGAFGMSEYPGDDLPGAGTKFTEGEFVVNKDEVHRRWHKSFDVIKEVYCVSTIPGPRPDKGDKYFYSWENIYELYSDKGFWDHVHCHESEIERYNGEVPLGLQIMQKIFLGEAHITVGRMKEVFGTDFTENTFIKRRIEDENLNDDSPAPPGFLLTMYGFSHLGLSSKPTYRDYTDKKLSKGIFWVIYDKLIYCAVTCDKNGKPLEELNENATTLFGAYNHKIYWSSLPTVTTQGKSYNYFPRGRVEIANGLAKVFLSPYLCADEIKEKIVRQFGLAGIEIKYIPDGSNHYRCYLDNMDEV